MNEENITLEKVKSLYPKSKVVNSQANTYDVYPKVECCVRSRISKDNRLIYFSGPFGKRNDCLNTTDEENIYDIILELLQSKDSRIKVHIDSHKVLLYSLKIYIGIIKLGFPSLILSSDELERCEERLENLKRKKELMKKTSVNIAKPGTIKKSERNTYKSFIKGY